MTELHDRPDSASVKGKALSQNFVWGVATASYQIEGAANEGGRGESIWDRFSHTPGKVAHGDTGDAACDHYHRYREDIALMTDLGVSAYRFSVAWSRIFPTGVGPVNQRGIDFYNRLVDALLEAGIQPMLTLYHWDLPQTLQDIGGWANPDIALRFEEYAAACFGALGDRVKNWITLNEPWVFVHMGHISGEHAPGLRDQALGFKAGHNALIAHGRAVRRYREMCPDGEIGITISLSPAHPLTTSEADVAAARRADAYGNRWFLDPIYRGDYPAEMREGFGDALPHFTPEQRELVQSPVDFIGANYYFRGMNADDPGGTGMRAKWSRPTEGRITAMGWEVYPPGMTETLCDLDSRYGRPRIYVTENGAAFDDVISDDGSIHDEDRRAYLESHIAAAEEAVRHGVRLEGYFVWSLLDNFEWAAGYDKRFGIIYVDYATQKRTPKDSARWYADRIRRGPLG